MASWTMEPRIAGVVVDDVDVDVGAIAEALAGGDGDSECGCEPDFDCAELGGTSEGAFASRNACLAEQRRELRQQEKR